MFGTSKGLVLSRRGVVMSGVTGKREDDLRGRLWGWAMGMGSEDGLWSHERLWWNGKEREEV